MLDGNHHTKTVGSLVMDRNENYFLTQNKLFEEKIDWCIHNIETRLDKLYEKRLRLINDQHDILRAPSTRLSSPFSVYTYRQFKSPYIRDFKNFSGPTNKDVEQIRGLTGTENIDLLIRHKYWSKEYKQQLGNAVLDFYSQIHLVELIKQKNILHLQLQETPQNRGDIIRKLSLIEEQTEQVKARKEQRIFVPEDRSDPSIDWCAISAKLANTHHDALDCRLMWSNELHWSINVGEWTKEEDVCLFNAVQKFGKNDWDSVAKELNSNRLPWQCCSRYQQEFINSYCGPSPINNDDSEKIIEIINLCRIGNFVPWNQVMYFIQYHSLLQVKYQWHKILSERKSNESWSHSEDILLIDLVDKFGLKDWSRISNYIPGRSNKSCRERYMMRLKFQKRAVGNWRPNEDKNLQALVERFGTNWSLISAHFSERNSHQLRNRYELLKNELDRIGPIRHKKLYRNSEGFLVSLNGRRPKPQSQREVDERLLKIFSTYQNVKSSSKSLVCRSAQDDYIHQSVTEVIRKAFFGTDCRDNLLNSIIEIAIKRKVSSKYELISPSISTLRGFNAWSILQDYLGQFKDFSSDLDAFTSTPEYHHTLKIVISLFLWPAILSRINPPELDIGKFQSSSIIERDSRNLYKIREIQKKISTSET